MQSIRPHAGARRDVFHDTIVARRERLGRGQKESSNVLGADAVQELGCTSSLLSQYDARAVLTAPLQLFVPVQLANFSIVPPHLRLVLVNVVSLFWNAYLSYANSASGSDTIEAVETELKYAETKVAKALDL